ncbi:MAG: hypothetical protein WD669_03205 [Pirellulales bacterium]
MTIHRALLGSILLCLPLTQNASGEFVAADFQIVTTTNPTFRPGEIVIIDGKLTNLSSQVAVFGGNIEIAGASFEFLINGAPGFTSPYFEGLDVDVFPNQNIAPGASVQFPFLSIDTTPTIPLGAVVELTGGNLLFANIPPSTAGPFVDFFIPLTASTSVSVPEPATLILALIPCGHLALSRRPQRRRGQ